MSLHDCTMAAPPMAWGVTYGTTWRLRPAFSMESSSGAETFTALVTERSSRCSNMTYMVLATHTSTSWYHHKGKHCKSIVKATLPSATPPPPHTHAHLYSQHHDYTTRPPLRVPEHELGQPPVSQYTFPKACLPRKVTRAPHLVVPVQLRRRRGEHTAPTPTQQQHDGTCAHHAQETTS